jgi:hypothetical protein
MYRLLSRSSLFAVSTVALLLGGCATEEEVKKAQATADQAMSAAQQAQQAANAAQATANEAKQAADKANADIGTVNSRLDAIEAAHQKRKGQRG